MTFGSSCYWNFTLAGLLVVISSGFFPALPQTGRYMARSGQPQTVHENKQAWSARWSWNALVGVEENDSSVPILFVVNGEGHSERLQFRIPEAGHIWVYDLAAGPDGAIVLSGSASFDDGQAGAFLAHIGPGRKQQTVIRTSPYVPKKVALAANGVIWAVGWNLDEAGHAEGNILKRFDKSGELLSTSAVRARSRFPNNGVEYSVLRASADRIGWVSNAYEYIEFSLDGPELYRSSGPPITEEYQIHNLSFALSKDNRAMVGAATATRWDVWILDRENRSWVPIEVNGAAKPGWGLLLGFDDDSLVAAEGRRTIQRYRFVPRNDQR